MAKYRVGVVGVGSRTVHGPLWARTLASLPNVDLVRLVDDEPESLASTAAEVEVEQTSDDPRTVLEATDLDIAVVNTIDQVHAEQVGFQPGPRVMLPSCRVHHGLHPQLLDLRWRLLQKR